MNEKDKVILNDGTELEIEQSSSTGIFTMKFASLAQFQEAAAKLKPSNLESYQVQNQAGLTVSRPENKECRHCGIDIAWNDAGNIAGVTAVWYITDVDMTARAIKEIQEGQTVQDGAIEDMAAVVSTVAEQLGGGGQ